MSNTSVVKCAFNDSWSLVWDQHEGLWVLEVHYSTGDSDTVSFGIQELQDLVDLTEAYKNE